MIKQMRDDLIRDYTMLDASGKTVWLKVKNTRLMLKTFKTFESAKEFQNSLADMIWKIITEWR